MLKFCKCCGKEFETNNPQKLFCDRDHYLPCPVCGKPVLKKDRDFTRPNKCCSSECSTILRRRRFKPKKCVICGETFIPSTGCKIVCDNTHYRNCEICGKPFVITLDTLRSNVTTCSHKCTLEKLKIKSREKYGTDHPMQSAEVQKNFHDAMIKKYGVAHALQIDSFKSKQKESAYRTNMEHNGVPYACLLPQCIEAQGKIISNINREFGDKLKQAGLTYSFEKRLDNKSFDIVVESLKVVIEIDPTYTHNSYMNHWGEPKEKNYHLNKTLTANKNGYRCIHVFDWDSFEDIVNLLSFETKIYARNCKLREIDSHTASEFLNENHLQKTCRNQTICIGLFYDDEVVQIMTFGKPRYSQKYEWELLRLCSKKGTYVVGGASKLFSYAVQHLSLHNIISYCDIAKFSGNVYEKIGMSLERVTPPQKIWSKNSEKITSNLLRQQGYDRLFHTSYGKGSSNEDLMMKNGWLPIYDCGQYVYTFNK